MSEWNERKFEVWREKLPPNQYAIVFKWQNNCINSSSLSRTEPEETINSRLGSIAALNRWFHPPLLTPYEAIAHVSLEQSVSGDFTLSWHFPSHSWVADWLCCWRWPLTSITYMFRHEMIQFPLHHTVDDSWRTELIVLIGGAWQELLSELAAWIESTSLAKLQSTTAERSKRIVILGTRSSSGALARSKLWIESTEQCQSRHLPLVQLQVISLIADRSDPNPGKLSGFACLTQLSSWWLTRQEIWWNKINSQLRE